MIRRLLYHEPVSVLDQILSRAAERRRRIAFPESDDPRTVAAVKRLAREGADLGIDQQMRLERDAAVRALPSDDVAEGLDAFENRRAPRFKA